MSCGEWEQMRESLHGYQVAIPATASGRVRISIMEILRPDTVSLCTLSTRCGQGGGQGHGFARSQEGFFHTALEMAAR